ncbi:hypothetical protein BZG36_01184 [Bifiguratus adelaidae]|uniref:CHCH domain-containing protein n=1 Tax=Bifiguratus adelaidae TaxID=1938954 RepID=A0A261Y5V9_9FUNG|nr:hypothetical protein BZG36_01184 [Bifiguratus adelaidae]
MSTQQDQAPSLSTSTIPACDYKPLQECLRNNNNDQSKCRKEWEEFREACRAKQLASRNQTPCEACKDDA